MGDVLSQPHVPFFTDCLSYAFRSCSACACEQSSRVSANAVPERPGKIVTATQSASACVVAARSWSFPSVE